MLALFCLFEKAPLNYESQRPYCKRVRLLYNSNILQNKISVKRKNGLFYAVIEHTSPFVSGQSNVLLSASSGAIIQSNIASVNATSISFSTSIVNDNWQATLYHSNTSCTDINGDSLPNNECEITTPNTWTAQPVDLVLSSLIPGKQYNITLEEITFRNGTDDPTNATTFPVSGVFCPRTSFCFLSFSFRLNLHALIILWVSMT